MGAGRGKVSVFTLREIKGQEKVSHVEQVAVATKRAPHRVSAGCRGPAAPRRPSSLEPGSAERHHQEISQTLSLDIKLEWSQVCMKDEECVCISERTRHLFYSHTCFIELPQHRSALCVLFSLCVCVCVHCLSAPGLGGSACKPGVN